MNLLPYLSLSDGTALLLAVAVKGTLLFLLAFLVAGFLRRASAATRHAVWAFALGAVLLLPALFVVLPGWQVPVLPGPLAAPPAPPAPPVWVAPAVPKAPVAPAAPRPPAVTSLHPFHADHVPLHADHRADHEVQVRIHREGMRALVIERREAVAPVAAPTSWVREAALPGPLRDWRALLLVVWGVGAAVVAMRWFFAVLGAWRLVQHAEPVYDLDWLELKERIAFGMDLDRPVRLLRSDRLAIPVAGGVFDPVVVLPRDADEWDEERREVVLTHELAHVLRRDCLTQSMAQGSLALHWFNPLAWLAYRRFMIEREHACDDYVLNHGARASDYAQHLVQIARRFRREPLALAATAPMARRSNLEGRILSILDPTLSRGEASRTKFAVVGVLTLALAVPLAAFQPVAATSHVEAVAAPTYEHTSAPVLAFALPERASDETFRWEGRVGAGGFVEVHGVNGAIRARTGSGDRVRVEAEKTSRRGQEDQVRIVVEEFANGVVLCAVYPGQRAECRPGQGAQGDIRDSDVQVAFDVVLPENVRFVGHTVNGSVKTEALGADVEARAVNGSIETASRGGNVTARTVNGSITAEAAGLVRAHTTNGSIRARLGRAEWDGEMAFETTNGSIVLDVPASLSADVRARAQTGSIKSDFPLRIQRIGYVGSEAEGQVGAGGRRLDLRVLNGSIQLRHSSGAFGSRIDRDHEFQREMERQLRRHERELRERELREREVDFEALGLMLDSLGPVVELAMAEAGRAMAAIDFEAEIERAMAEVDWDEIQAEIDVALAEAAVEVADHQREAWAEADLEEALEDVRSERADVEAQLKEWRATGSASRAEAVELRASASALRRAEKEMERALCDMRARQGKPGSGRCSD